MCQQTFKMLSIAIILQCILASYGMRRLALVMYWLPVFFFVDFDFHISIIISISLSTEYTQFSRFTFCWCEATSEQTTNKTPEWSNKYVIECIYNVIYGKFLRSAFSNHLIHHTRADQCADHRDIYIYSEPNAFWLLIKVMHNYSEAHTSHSTLYAFKYLDRKCAAHTLSHKKTLHNHLQLQPNRTHRCSLSSHTFK